MIKSIIGSIFQISKYKISNTLENDKKVLFYFKIVFKDYL